MAKNTKPSVKPLADRVLLQRIEEAEEIKGGIIIPDSAKEAPQHGNVVAVGPGKLNDNGQLETIELQPGDHILYQKYTGQEVTVDSVEYIVIRFQDVLARLEDAKAPAASKKK